MNMIFKKMNITIIIKILIIMNLTSNNMMTMLYKM